MAACAELAAGRENRRKIALHPLRTASRAGGDGGENFSGGMKDQIDFAAPIDLLRVFPDRASPQRKQYHASTVAWK